ncbi:hypothetical protein DFP72DRAFT_843274 [Ephemerocybe angulata]|uniref:Uncharacterized protein n=1 Tax=Ephemerocybe angulata TaxID=980116 RepID=A0A8H6IA54_9AGAR|nr:hypothetical protein DFP72DRAFT_843274 [Tulosesus angulatus]
MTLLGQRLGPEEKFARLEATGILDITGLKGVINTCCVGYTILQAQCGSGQQLIANHITQSMDRSKFAESFIDYVIHLSFLVSSGVRRQTSKTTLSTKTTILEPATEAQLLTINGPRLLSDLPTEEELRNSAAEQLQHSLTLPRDPLFVLVTTVFLSSLTSRITFRNLTLMSEAIPQLQRLQIATVSPEDDIASIPERVFPSLE